MNFSVRSCGSKNSLPEIIADERIWKPFRIHLLFYNFPKIIKYLIKYPIQFRGYTIILQAQSSGYWGASWKFWRRRFHDCLSYNSRLVTFRIHSLTKTDFHGIVNKQISGSAYTGPTSAQRYFGCWLIFEGSIVDMYYTIGIIS